MRTTDQYDFDDFDDFNPYHIKGGNLHPTKKTTALINTIPVHRCIQKPLVVSKLSGQQKPFTSVTGRIYCILLEYGSLNGKLQFCKLRNSE